jgi:putative transposase
MALSAEEWPQIQDILNTERFADTSPREVYATLLHEGRYLCSWPTMYRILREAHQARRRRDQARQGNYSKSELLAVQP